VKIQRDEKSIYTIAFGWVARPIAYTNFKVGDHTWCIYVSNKQMIKVIDKKRDITELWQLDIDQTVLFHKRTKIKKSKRKVDERIDKIIKKGEQNNG